MTDYKNFLNLPNTGFPMRGNLPKREPLILQRWYEQDLYGAIRRAKKGKKMFILHDGPPYANGGIHIGHSVNKILKDIIIKSKGLMGYDAPYIPGWDCHGLPIELKVEQIIGKPGENVGVSEFRTACRRYVVEQIEKQKKDFIRLGVLGDWENPHLTMNFATEANIVRALAKIIANGHLYKGAKPVHWCIDCRSALAEAEVEYFNQTSPSVDVAFEAADVSALAAKFGLANFKGKISIIIWTTTPWTLPGNRAIAIHPEFEYQLIEADNKGYILASKLVNSSMLRSGIKNWKVRGSIKGYMLEFVQFRHPFMWFDIPAILSKHIRFDTGTGAVHTAPGHGLDDYIAGQQYGLEVANVVAEDGSYLAGTLKALDGLEVFKANRIVIALLQDSHALIHVEKVQHSYPHCWRHKTPIIFRTTPQWFLSMDKSELREQSLEAIKGVQWLPDWSQTRIKKMIKNRPDWCISRQRAWGVPMALFLHNKTKELHPRNIEFMEIVANRIEKDGIEAWWDLNPADILGDDVAHYHKSLDTLDVWFDSGCTHSSVVAIRPEFSGHAADMYLEGSDQHRGWFMSSLMTSIAMRGKAPYHQVLTHGFTVDGKGRKMSKSVGNVISPKKIMDKLGADILRLWVACTDYTSEVAISEEILKRSADIYRRIRNTSRFLLANLKGFDPMLHKISMENMVALDKWAVSRSKAVQEEIITAYNQYDFYKVVRRTMQFCSVDMGSFYLDIIKDRQYTAKTDSIARRSCQTALYHIAEALVRWIAPIMSFTADEIWAFIPGERAQSVFTEEWYDGLFALHSAGFFNDNFWGVLLKVRNETNKILEQARADQRIGNSLEASITLYAEKNIAISLRKLGNELRFALLTSGAKVENYDSAGDDAVQCTEFKELKISLKKANGEKCKRCWHYERDIGSNLAYPDICDRCIMNVAGLGEERQFI